MADVEAVSFVTTEVARDDHRVLLLRLRELRGARSLEDASAMVGIRADELSRIERGQTKQVRWDTLLRLLAAYECQPDELLEVRTDPVPSSDSPRAVMLAAIHSGLRAPVPHRTFVVRDDVLEPNDAVSDELAEQVERGPVRRKFVPADLL